MSRFFAVCNRAVFFLFQIQKYITMSEIILNASDTNHGTYSTDAANPAYH